MPWAARPDCRPADGERQDVSGCQRTLGGCRGGWRSGPTYRSGPERYFPFAPGQFQAPEIPAGSPRPREGPENHRADHILAQWRLGKGVGIIDVLLTAGIWTICVDGSRTFPTGTVSGRYDNSSLRKAGQWGNQNALPGG